MTRLPLLQWDEMNAEQREVVEWFRKEKGREPQPTHLTWMRSPALAKQVLEFGHHLRYEILDARKRELAILIAGRACRSPVEWHLHLPHARKAGIEEEVISDLAANKKPDFKDEQDDVLYDVCMDLLKNLSVSDANYERGMRLLGPKEFVELVAITGFYVLMAMLIGAFDFRLPEGVEPAFVDETPPRGPGYL
ncbi:MAG: carboxymuconolactone decarboxylase family protein [Microvirga sp.]|nr:carboxymuconolactone decarboxylase family protein [Microvirga sp.]